MTERPAHLPSDDDFARWRSFTAEHPMRVLMSGCLAGGPCGVDGTSYGEYPTALRLKSLPNVRVIEFCPEDFSFGTPRATPNVHAGNGHDVLDGNARVFAQETMEDWTNGMVRAAHEMLRIAQAHDVHLAFLMDISAACGSQAIYDGPRHLKQYTKGPGVCAALLMRHGFPVVSWREYRTLQRLFKMLDDSYVVDENAVDFHEDEWYRGYFK
jgi:uncharacterized protein YbbK (DUF523 family)